MSRLFLLACLLVSPLVQAQEVQVEVSGDTTHLRWNAPTDRVLLPQRSPSLDDAAFAFFGGQYLGTGAWPGLAEPVDPTGSAFYRVVTFDAADLLAPLDFAGWDINFLLERPEHPETLRRSVDFHEGHQLTVGASRASSRPPTRFGDGVR